MAKKCNVSNLKISLNDTTQKTVVASWSFTPPKKRNGKVLAALKEYKIQWSYRSKKGKVYTEDSSTTSRTVAEYTFPDNSTAVKITVTPVSKKTTKWTGVAATSSYFYLTSTRPETPSAPKLTVDGLKATLSIDNYDSGIQESTGLSIWIRCQVLRDGTDVVFDKKCSMVSGGELWDGSSRPSPVAISLGYGHTYKARAIAWSIYTGLYSLKWSDYGSEVSTPPCAPTWNTKLKSNPYINSDGEVVLQWNTVSGAKKYVVEYATNVKYFNESPENVSSVTIETGRTAHITGLTKGYRYYFRVQAVNDGGESPFTSALSIIYGTEPAAPTTWSNVNSISVGESINLYWLHNSQDESSQTAAQIYMSLTTGGKTTEATNNVTNLPKKTDTDTNPIGKYVVNVSSSKDGYSIYKWKMRTKGILDKWSPWSTLRTFYAYSKPTMTIMPVLDSTGQNGFITSNTSSNSEPYSVVSFPIKIKGTAGPTGQTPIGMAVTITSLAGYYAYDITGQVKYVGPNTEVYHRIITQNDSDVLTDEHHFTLSLSPSDVDLEDGAKYKISCTLSTDAGLSVDAEPIIFSVEYTDASVTLDADFNVSDDDSVSLAIQPAVLDAEGNEIYSTEGNIKYNLYVYRRDYNGEFTLIAGPIDNLEGITVIDPHPSLANAVYRLVAQDTATGAISFSDTESVDIESHSVIIQWGDRVMTYLADTDDDPSAMQDTDSLEAQYNSSTVLKLPYNIGVSDSYSKDVSLVEYIGRSRPVSYYGTQLGETSTWTVEIPKDDLDTLWLIRRLAIYTGDVYVREPSGSGYWANVEVSYQQTHSSLTIPVTFNITRVEGGV